MNVSTAVPIGRKTTPPALSTFRGAAGLHDLLTAQHGVNVSASIAGLRPQQEVAVDWAVRSTTPYLLINAPTGSGKTLLLGVLGCLLGQSWTYATHTIRLQGQVETTFPGLPVATGRANHPCLIGMETHKREVSAAEGICTALDWCEHSGQAPTNERQHELYNAGHALCDYYYQRKRALDWSNHRTANYSYIMADYHTFVEDGRSDVILCDEAHSLDEVASRSAEINISPPVYRRYGLNPPLSNNAADWKAWAVGRLWSLPPVVGRRTAPDMLRMTLRQQLEDLTLIANPDEWLVERDKYRVKIYPLWGQEVVPTRLLGLRGEAPPWRGVFTSATLLGADYFATRMGLAEGSWSYLELPHTFPTANRPVNYAPIVPMNNVGIEDPATRHRMQLAIDHLIEWYMVRGKGTGLIHAVSNRYRDYMLTESRFRGIMTVSPDEHAAAVALKQNSVLVAANVLEGWDGIDDLCRFVIMPKVPYANMADTKVRLQMAADPKSYDYSALIGVVQGTGRGVRTETDHCDNWILDSNFEPLFHRRKSWIPKWWLDAYHPHVKLPE